ncbi:MAG: D-alanyl-D-alanine carboxypeptidase family protein [Eubacteriales bacterium]
MKKSSTAEGLQALRSKICISRNTGNIKMRQTSKHCASVFSTKTLKTRCAFIVAVLLLCGVTVDTSMAFNVEFPSVSAQSAVVYDADSDRFLYEKQSDRKMKIASTTKIMTAIVVLENCNLDDVVTIEKKHYAEGSSMYLREGEKVSVRDLLYGLMLMSGNDAALALAYHCAGGPDEFAVLMNNKAKELGMVNSSFRNPNGLDQDGHYSTARDMALLASYCMKNENFRAIVGTKSGHFAGRYMSNHNKLLSRLEGTTGLKTGYTSSAGRCLVSSVKRNGREVIVVTLNAPDDWRDHIALCNKAFESYSETDIALKGEKCVDISVQNGVKPRMSVNFADDCRIWLADGERVEKVIYAPKFVYAPVFKGDIAGELVVLINGSVIKRVPLVFDSDVENVDIKPGLFDRVRLFFKNVVSITPF